MLKRPCEHGSSVVTFVLALPLLVVFLFAIMDVGRTVFLHMALADAAHAACQVVVDDSEDGVTQSALREAALTAAPALAVEGLSVSVKVRYGDTQTESYGHRLYDEESAAFEKRISQIEKREVVVTVGLEGSYLTPLGNALSVAQGRSDSGFSHEAQATGVIDTTVKGGSW